ncbi:hypothetical protein [Proteiniphilum sp.]|uniref:hypothetical protein n=1 Tax=Proteiniphilum sp. TaxID=1926877 RepID=UPI002B213320|nr:hypothetical protein [Proteiniphilum sp.]MEA4918150.1 hypothetical protein [Proteiniphilum sp.]
MNDLIINLFKYFSKFVPKEVLKGIFIQPDGSKKAGYDEIVAEVMSLPDDNIIPGLDKFVISINESFVSERIKNATGFILFVEYGTVSADHSTIKGITQHLAVTVVYNFSNNNNDNLNEILNMDTCLDILDRIIRIMGDEQESLDFCANGELVTYPVEIRPVDPVEFYGFGGWCAMFSNANTIL